MQTGCYHERYRAPFGQAGRSALTVTLCPHFRLTDNLWFITVLQGANGESVSKRLVERNCHHMLQTAAIICVKSQCEIKQFVAANKAYVGRTISSPQNSRSEYLR